MKNLQSKPLLTFMCLLSLPWFLSDCSSFSPEQQDGPPSHAVNVADIPNAVVRPLPKSRYGNPSSYVVNGKRYFVLPSARGYKQRGIASWYGMKFHGKLTSTRETFNTYAMTAASPILPLPCFVRVTNLDNHRSVIVKVNDRGPFEDNRIIDLSYAAAAKLGMLKHGTAPVEVVAIDQHNTGTQQPIASPNYLLQKWRKEQPKQHASKPASTQSLINKPMPGIYLQIGAYSNYRNAQHIQQKAQQLVHYPVNIKKTTVKQRTIYVVKIGPLKTQSNVSEVEHALNSASFG